MALQVWLPLNGNIKNQGLSNITVTNNGATVNDNGKIGKCYSFDGSDDFISLSGQDLYNIFKGGNYKFSITTWIYHSDSTRAIIFGDYNLSGYINFNIELTTSHAFRFYWGGNPDKTFNGALTLAAWNHIAIVYDGNKLIYYKDGVKSDELSVTLSSKNKTSGAFYLGRDSRTGATTLNGRLNDFRIYDHALSAKEVKDISKGLILHYPLEGNVDNFVTDCSGYNNNGTIVGTLTSVDNSPRYVTATYMNNTNTSNHVEVNKIFCADNIRSISFWVKCSKSKNQVLIADPGVMVIGLLNNLIYVNPTSSTPFSTTNFITNEWNHIVAIRNGTSYLLYINGQLETLNGTNNYYIHNGTNLWLFNRNSNNSYAAEASMSDVRIYSTILSAEDIMELYNTSAYICNNNIIKAYEFKEFPYLLVEYIKSTGALTINLDYYPNPLTELEIELAFEPNENTNASGKKNSWFGCRSDGTTANFSTNFGDTAALKNTMFYWMNTTYASGATVCQLSYTYSDLQLKNTWHYQNGKVIYLNTTKNVTAKTTTNLKPLYFFGYDTTPFNRYNLKLYSLKIKENNTLVRDFIPVRVGSVGYLYDKISNKLFENSGTNDFILGQDVEDVYQDVNIYKNGLIECDEFTENTGLTTFGDSYVLSEEFIEI